MEAQEEQSDQTSPGDEEEATETQASAVIEIHDSMTECEEETSPSVVHMEEKSFVSSLHTFMKDRGSPIERIPHLGFKQINLWMIYTTVEKLGGYDSVTARRLWKKVYDELGGSPGSTSAATCTRKHYEKLVLPFERHIKGEDDRPLPTSKPRKPYKRNSDSKFQKAEKKRKRCQSDREGDPEMAARRGAEDACGGDAALRPLPALWAAPPPDRHYPDRAQPAGRCASVYARLVQVPASNPWTGPAPPAAGEVISPLEKKKRMAQASLSCPPGEEAERPSVIRRSQSPPAQAYPAHRCSSSDGSPVPLSPLSSRSPSPYSVSSEDGTEEDGDKPAGAPALPDSSSDSVGSKSACGEESKPSSCAEAPKTGTAPQTDSAKDSTWKSRAHVKYVPQAFQPRPSLHLKSDWAPASTSCFTKVVPKAAAAVAPLRPAPLRPPYEGRQGGLPRQGDYLACAKKPSAPWLLQTDKRDKSRVLLQKVPGARRSPPRAAAPAGAVGRPQSCVPSSCDKAGRDSQQPSPLYPGFLSHRMRLPPSQLMYHHVPLGLAPPALLGSSVYPYPYPAPQISPQMGFFSPAMTPIYPHNF